MPFNAITDRAPGTRPTPCPSNAPTPFRPRRLALATAVGLALCTLSHPVSAVGFGAGQITSVLGQPLDFSVQIAGEADAASLSCLSAEVLAGESRVDPHSVTSHVEPAGTHPGAWLRVQTTVAIDEPVLTVVIGAGCTARLSRRFVVFVDPPHERVATSLPAVDTLQAMGPDPVAAAPSTAPTSAPTSTADAFALVDPMSIASRPADAGATTPRPPASAHHRAGETLPTRPAREPARHVAVHKPHTGVAAASRANDRATPTRTADASTPPAGARLRLDDEPDFAALSTSAAPSAIASDAAPASTADAARYSALEARLAKLDADSAAASASVDRLRRQLHSVTAAASVRPESQRSWLWQGLSAVLGLAVALLAWQRLRPAPASDWRDSISPAADAPAVPLVGANLNAPPVTAASMDDAPATPTMAATPAAVRAVASEPTATPVRDASTSVPAPTPGPARATGGMTVEELLDVEQQFDFFAALGQDAAAIELMRSLLLGPQAEHPMPYLKLMDVHRRLGQEADYRQIHAEFSKRFNAAAPDWQAAPSSPGRTIEDYPDQLAALIDTWPTPADAESRLGDWIARTTTAANDARFDMPAFRDLVFLQTLAREMTARDSRPVVLQPLAFEPMAPSAVEPSASMAPPEWSRAKGSRAAAATGVDIELDLELASDDEDDGRFDLPLSASQAAVRR